MATARVDGDTDAELSWADVAVHAEQLARKRPGPWDRVAAHAGWEDDRPTYHSPVQVRAHWFAEWRRRMGYGEGGDYDNTILLTAKKGKGQGKSAAAFDLAFELDRRFAPEWRTKTTYDPAAFLDLVNSLSRYEVGLLDDAGDALLRTEFWSESSRLIQKAMIIARDTNASTVICIPTIKLFNSAVLNSLVDYWGRVERRGEMKIHPRPDERYTEVRGIGWFPDPEWNPYTWANPRDWPQDRREIWLEYRKFRKEFRKGSLATKAEELRRGGPTSASTQRFACEPCGITFQRRDQLRRHLGTAKHQERAAGGMPRPGPSSAPSGTSGPSAA